MHTQQSYLLFSTTGFEKAGGSNPSPFAAISSIREKGQLMNIIGVVKKKENISSVKVVVLFKSHASIWLYNTPRL